MAGNNSIQFVRGTSSQRASHTEISLVGQPIYETDTNRLYVGDGKTNVNDLSAVKASAADEAVITDNVKDQHKGAGIKIWIGTQAELEDLPETDEDTIYYITDIVSLLELDKALKTLKVELADGSFKVGKAGAADNVMAQINGKAITAIFESNGTTAKNATKLATARNMQVNLASGNVQSFDGSGNATEIGVKGVLPAANGGTGQSNLDNVTVGNAEKATQDANGNVISSTYATKAEATRTATYTQQGQVKMASTTNGGTITSGNSDDTVPTIKNICDWTKNNFLPSAEPDWIEGTLGSLTLPSAGWYVCKYTGSLDNRYPVGLFYWEKPESPSQYTKITSVPIALINASIGTHPELESIDTLQVSSEGVITIQTYGSNSSTTGSVAYYKFA